MVTRYVIYYGFSWMVPDWRALSKSCIKRSKSCWRTRDEEPILRIFRRLSWDVYYVWTKRTKRIIVREISFQFANNYIQFRKTKSNYAIISLKSWRKTKCTYNTVDLVHLGNYNFCHFGVKKSKQSN